MYLDDDIGDISHDACRARIKRDVAGGKIPDGELVRVVGGHGDHWLEYLSPEHCN